MPMRKLSWLVVASVAAFAMQSQAQSIPLTITCNDMSGRAVTGVQVRTGIIAKATIDPDARPVIEYDPRPVDDISPQLHLFIYAHECGHHALGHLLRHSIADEQGWIHNRRCHNSASGDAATRRWRRAISFMAGARVQLDRLPGQRNGGGG